MKITRTNYEKMMDSFSEGLRSNYSCNNGMLINYFRIKVEEDFITDWEWTALTPNTYYVYDGVWFDVHKVSDYDLNAAIDNCVGECKIDIEKAFKQKYSDDEEALEDTDLYNEFEEQYYEENLKEGILDYCVDADRENFEDSLFYNEDFENFEIIEE